MPSAPGSVPFRSDRLGWILLGLCLLHLVLLVPALVYPDLNLDYPFMDGDSHDWIAAGLHLAGSEVRDPGRSPLLPVVIALLERLGALSWLPVVLQLLFHGTVLAFYGLAARQGRGAAFAVALALLLNHSLHGISLQVMADVPAACLLFLAGRGFILRRYVASGLWGGLSALAQSAAVLAVVPAALTVLLHRRRDLRSAGLWAGAFLFVALQGLWLAVRVVLSGSAGNLTVQHWSLIHPGADSVLFYLYSLASLVGLPGALLLAAGLVLAAREARRDADQLFWLTLFGVLALFFVFVYDFDAKRFLVYLIWPAGLLLAGSLSHLRRGPGFAAAAGLLIAGSVFPLPGTGNDPSWVGLWPLPPVYAQAPLTGKPTGSPVLQPSGITLRTFPAADLPRFSNLGRVWSARRAWAAVPRPRRLDPARVAADRTALFLALKASDGGGRYRTWTRLGNALRKRVQVVPASWLEPWEEFLAIEPVGVIEPDYAVFRVRLPAAPGSWLLVTLADSPLRQELAALAGRPPRPAPPELRRALARAGEVRRGIPESAAMVALLPGRDPFLFYLPFLVERHDLFVIEPGEEPAVRARIAAAPRLAERRVAGVEIREIWIVGQRAAVVVP